MSIIISIYSPKSFKEYILPSMNNANYSILVDSESFGLLSDLSLKLEVVQDHWRIRATKNYNIVTQDNERYVHQTLRDGDVLMVTTDNMERLFLFVREEANVFRPYIKYELGDKEKVTIGKAENVDIRYNYKSMVSNYHCQIEKRGDSYWLVNGPTSKNGTYVNSKRIDTEIELKYGDYINILGLHIVFMGKMIGIDAHNGKVFVTPDLKKINLDSPEFTISSNIKKVSNGKDVYHRSPRIYEHLVTDPVKIEGPPELHIERKQSLLMAVGPSVTMALPMILGCVMMIYASSDGSSNLYMYSGLVMALSSALIGVLWAIINIRAEKKERKEEEEYRFKKYSDYLIEKSDEIKDIYTSTSTKLLEMYPSTDVCLKYMDGDSHIWNRNRKHSDFLTHRLGIGDIAFQMPIQIPDKQFHLYDDNLRTKPSLIKENFSTLYDVPVTINYLEHPMIGLVGGNKKIGALDVMKVLSAQLIANNCYTDVKLAYLFDEDIKVEREAFSFAKWVPHVWAEDHNTRYIGSNEDEAREVLYELAKIFRMRTEEESRRDDEQKTYYVLFVSNPDFLKGELLEKYVNNNDGTIGLTTVFLAERYEDLPNNCEFIIQNDSLYQGIYGVYDREDEKVHVKFDSVDLKQLNDFSRFLSSIQVLETEEGGDIPNSVSFFEMYGVNSLEEFHVIDLWTKNRIYENIRGYLGQKASGAPCYLDVHEKYHGPHGLVAGTTGSGKSETLQTYMLSLAINYSPDDIGFFIIDYKGGGMANLFDGLPHMIGQISNLSGNQVKRAMISIKSENKRRQRVFNENGVNNINAYTKLYKNGEALIPIPHMFIIIDEFAELKREEPEFMKELISVAQVGRSLGVHLILATQKPSGTVDDNIWSNSKFRLCLRVQDKQDSTDMLHRPDAAFITQAGRGYLQVGNDELYELFQSGYSGATYHEDDDNVSNDIAKMISLNGTIELTGNIAKAAKKKRKQVIWIEKLISVLQEVLRENHMYLVNIGTDPVKLSKISTEMIAKLQSEGIDYPFNDFNVARIESFIRLVKNHRSKDTQDYTESLIQSANIQHVKLPEVKEKTQLEAIKDYLALVAEENNYQKPSQLWMPVLPTKKYLTELDEYKKKHFAGSKWPKADQNELSLQTTIGYLDDPENQIQLPLTLDLAEIGNIAIVGPAVSGKSTLLQTMMFGLIQAYTPKQINIYGIDFSSKMMSAFETAPQVGGVMYDSDEEKIKKFFTMMNGILKERKNLFRGGNYKQYMQKNHVVIPAIIIMIDNFGAFSARMEEKYIEQIIQLSKEGINNGIYLVVSGLKFSFEEIHSKLKDSIAQVLTLQVDDKADFVDYFHVGGPYDVTPESNVKGRGVVEFQNRVLEYQALLALEAENDYDRMGIISNICDSMKKAWTGRPARPIPEIPKKPIWPLLRDLEEFGRYSESPKHLPVGYDADNASVYSIPLDRTYCHVAWGASRTGLTNYMKICIQSALEKKDAEICIIDVKDHRFKAYEEYENVVYISDEREIKPYFKNLTPEFVKRNELKIKLVELEYEDDEIFDEVSKEKPIFIFISDLCWFVKHIYDANNDCNSNFFENIIEKGYLHNIYFITEMNVSEHLNMMGHRVYELMTGYKTGIHFGGETHANPVLSYDRISFQEAYKKERPGIGDIPDPINEGETAKVVIPLAKGLKKHDFADAL